MRKKGKGSRSLRLSRKTTRVVALLVGLVLIIAGYIFRLWELIPRYFVLQGNQLAVHVLDVGQGDSFLILTPERKAVLIDAGPPEAAEKVVEALSQHGVQQLDLVVATHPHADHIGGMTKVLDSFPVRTFLDSSQPHPTRTYTRMLEKIRDKGARFIAAETGQEFELDSNVKLHVLAPMKPMIQGSEGSDENANSVVIRLTYGEFSMLFAGDSERETELRLLGARSDLSARVLKVAHHGSRYATTRELLEQVHPEVAVISCGAGNDYGHPSQDTLNRLRATVRDLYRTDLEGEITILSDGNSYRVEMQHAPAGDLWIGRRRQKTETTVGGAASNRHRGRRGMNNTVGR